MAEEVEAALLEGKALRLASLVDPEKPYEYSPYTAVFVGDGPDDWFDEEYEDDVAVVATREKSGTVEDERARGSKETYAFTSAWFPEQAPRPVGDIPRHVSLEVDVEWPDEESEDSNEKSGQENAEKKTRERHGRGHAQADNDLPKLYTRRWLNGLCYWTGCPLQPVLFPWPADLLAMATNTATATARSTTTATTRS
jgi:hypothetical protein